MKPSATALASLALFALACASAFAVGPPTDEKLRGLQQEHTNTKTRALWDKLKPEERDEVLKFLRETKYVEIFKPDIMSDLTYGRRDAAIKLLVDTYRLPTDRAAVVVDLIGYANGLE